MFSFIFILVSIYTLFTFWFAISSFRENFPRAGILGLIASLIMAVALALYAWAKVAGLLEGSMAQTLQLVFGIVMFLFMLAMFIPLGRNPKALEGAKGMLEGNTEKFNQKDTAFNVAHVGGYGPEVGKQRWALQSRDPFGGIYWTLCMGLRDQADGKVKPKKTEGLSPGEITKEIKRTARYAGADLVGITTVKKDFTYSDNFSYEDSKLEVGPAVTTPVDLKHKYVIVFGKEMSFKRIQNTLTEKNEESLGEIGKTYYELAQIACGVAAFIRQLGYSAKAQHIRNEQIFHVPHAIDAGLGEQGRHNYLITKKYGPRIRLASVTTDLELVEDKPVDIGVQDFCQNCRLCEINCPSQALAAEKAVVRGYRKWPQEQEKCFLFWVTGGNTMGCTMCLKICPWNKPRTFVHKVSFFAATRSVVARRILYWITVIFYGRKIYWEKTPLPERIELPPEIQALVDSYKSDNSR
ncbi:MAG: 4Fe-4S dicluster domain-containing protein [Desulfobacteraceae bacterium]|nr:MAG: 4Fe-4S dicluster domain-containing protein [Desulfobacteraceae bacterium]